MRHVAKQIKLKFTTQISKKNQICNKNKLKTANKLNA